uniref:RING-type E3 ubiquitin transferase n=1 Tax=Astyanax mexicanus TaxID=7994 RepID=A0A8B9HRY9_ASTMX
MKALADSEEDYDCPICQEVFKTPVRTKSCRHKFLSKMRLHYKSCRKYKEEYGPISDAPPPPSSQNPVQIPSHSTGFIPIIPVYTPVNRYANTGSDQTVCPICSQLPWGEPYYCSRNLIGHMRLRHSFSYAGYMVRFQEMLFKGEIWCEMNLSCRKT